MFDWFSKKKSKGPIVGPKEPEETKVILHGHDLSKWQYLGRTDVGVIADKDHPTFLFCKKDNHLVRSYTIVGSYIEQAKKHQYVIKCLEPWRCGEHNIYTYAVDSQSDWLKEYMLDHFDCAWDGKTKWWKKVDETAKYKNAQKKQQTKVDTEPKIEDNKSNIISVDFSKGKAK